MESTVQYILDQYNLQDQDQDQDSDQDQPQGTHNITEFCLPEEETSEYIQSANVFNIFLCYFRQLHQRNQTETMFDHIDTDQPDSTNKCTELFYEHILEYNSSFQEDKDILYEADQATNHYCVTHNNTPIYTCKHLLPILYYLTGTDWANNNWSIISPKRT